MMEILREIRASMGENPLAVNALNLGFFFWEYVLKTSVGSRIC